jgi:hypothetical protein
MKDFDLVREYYAELRDDFCAFVVRCFAELNPGQELAMGGHIEVMVSNLAAVHDGQVRRLIINVPPRHLKSLIGSVAYPAWCLGHDPAATIMCVSYGQDLSDKQARDTRTVMKIGPGPTAFARMPSGEWSAASARVKPATAALVVSYCRLPPPATTERTEATLTMAPPLLRRISGTAALAQKT